MSHPALTARWRWRSARVGRCGAAHAAAGHPGPAPAGAADAGPADAIAAPAGAAGAGVAALDARRRLQLLLAGLWLLDGVLQLQPVMFTRRFPAMLAESAAGQPGVVAAPVTWAARLIAGHPAPANAAFAALQIALGLGLAWRPAIRPALAGSVLWGLAVWWLGEGLGGLFTGTASPAGGAPGAALLYAVLAVLLWPPRRESAVSPRAEARLDGVTGARGAVDGSSGAAGRRRQPVPFVAGQAIGVRGAAVVWLVLWAGLAALAVQPAVRAPHAFGGLLAGLSGDAPGWIARADQDASAALGGHGLMASVLLAVLMAAIGVAGCRPDRTPAAARAAVVVAVTFGVLTAAAGGFGALLTGMATDHGTGPVLALFALAYWPSRLALTASAGSADPAGSADAAEPADPSATRARPGSSGSSVTAASLGAPGPQAAAEGAGS